MNKNNISFIGNHSNTSDYHFRFEDYYDLYDIETFGPFKEQYETVRLLNKLFVAGSILLAVIDFLLLFSILSEHVRKEPSSWYLYHLNLVTILQVGFSLPRLETSLHETFGTCMFFAYTEWVLTLIYHVNIILMDFEIIASIFASDPIWKNHPEKRFYISMVITWISGLLVSAIIMFFGHDEHPKFPVCFNLNRKAEILEHVLNNLLPFIFTTSLMVAGVTLFIRSKRSPESFTHVTQDNIQSFNEWFVCFMTWNFFIALVEVLVRYMHTHAIYLGIIWDVAFQMTIFVIHVGLPMTCLLLEPVRTTYGEWASAGVKYLTVLKRSLSSDSSDIQLLRVDCSEEVADN